MNLAIVGLVTVAAIVAYVVRPRSKMTALACAESFLHVREDPKTPNRGTEIDGWMAAFPGLQGQAWCAAFATKMAKIKRRAAVWQIVEDARAAGKLHLGSDAPIGALCIFGRAGQNPLKPNQMGHANFLQADAGNGEAWFVGGNQAADRDDTDKRDGVTRQRRKRADILAWVEV